MSHGAAAELISAQWPSHVAPVPVSTSDLRTTQMGFMAAELAMLNNSTSSGSEKKSFAIAVSIYSEVWEVLPYNGKIACRATAIITVLFKAESSATK